MRVLITVFPSTAHFLPLVPYAWALQSAGHEVCFATPPGYPTGVAVPEFDTVITSAGLNAVICGQPAPLSMHDRAYPGFANLLPNRAETERHVAQLGIDNPTDRATWDLFYHFAMLTIRDYHPPTPRQDINAVIDFARDWQPDLVLWEPWFPVGGVAARVAGAAHARVLLAPDYTAWGHERFISRGRPSILAEAMRPLAEHHGIHVDDNLLFGDRTIDPLPAAMQVDTTVHRIPSRYVPYTGVVEQQTWLREPPKRPRIAITLGVSTRMFVKGDWGRTAKLMEAVADLDIEVVATLNDNQLLDLPHGLPDNVRTFDYVPLDQLLPTCSALISHGSIATVIAAASKGVPQLVCDTDEPTRVYGSATDDGIDWEFRCHRHLYSATTSQYLARHGAGLRLNHQTQTAQDIRDQLRRVLNEPSFRTGAAALRDEWLAPPSPADLVPTLEQLTAERRGAAW
ncbi:nucleotide disphospho-sugar-binding domain-containing protein [Micromonospora sediminicola]|uniref:nucleotide disphospho-sugar-binding domain-containing protein n=1 Tax=Micromonospora sediminicola TaxID=946078 RepID=UPI0033C3FC56